MPDDGELARSYAELRPLLFSIAYRMLGSVSDAEDVVQESFVRYKRALDDGVVAESPKAYLSAVATRLSLDTLKSARVRRESYVGTWLPEPLLAAGFDPRMPAFFAWLGVVPYLTLAAFRSTLAFIAARPAGSGLALDYGQPRAALPLLEQLAHDSLAARVQLAGEPFRLFFTPAEIARELAAFHGIEDLGSKEINARYFAGRSDSLMLRGSAGRLLSAWL